MSCNGRLLALLLILFTRVRVTHGEESVELPPREKFHLFLLIGQSNMAGRGKIEPQDQVAVPRVLMLSKEGKWVPATDPLHFDKKVAGVGLGRTFGIEIANSSPEITIGLIPCAVGGSPIDSWQPGLYYPPTKSHPWDDAIKRAKLALAAGELKGILWHQGESDSSQELSAVYEKKLHDLVGRLRRELDAPNVPFIVGQMGDFADHPWKASKKEVDRALRDLPQKVARTAYVSAAGLDHQGDGTHFDADSYRELGRRYAAAYLQLVKNGER